MFSRDEVMRILDDPNMENAEKLNALLNARSQEIGRDRANVEALNAQIAALTAERDTARNTIAQLEANQTDANALQAEINRYKDAEQARNAALAAAECERALKTRYDSVTAGKQFVNDYTRDGLYNQFKIAIGDAANAGKGDADVFAAITNGMVGIYANPNPMINIVPPSPMDNASITAEAFKNMTLDDQMKFANTNPAAYASIAKLI